MSTPDPDARVGLGSGVAGYVLVVDDDERLADVTAELLRRRGYAARAAYGGTEALAIIADQPPDAMLLDFDMPAHDAIDVLNSLRGRGGLPGFPVIILTGAKLSLRDQILALDSGASDYIVKGTDSRIIEARLRRALMADVAGVLQRGPLRLDVRTGEAWLGNRRLQLEHRPLSVLQYLAAREGDVVAKQELLTSLWSTNYQGFDHALEQAVHAARRALGDPRWIQTVRRVGYRFATPSAG